MSEINTPVNNKTRLKNLSNRYTYHSNSATKVRNPFGGRRMIYDEFTVGDRNLNDERQTVVNDSHPNKIMSTTKLEEIKGNKQKLIYVSNLEDESITVTNGKSLKRIITPQVNERNEGLKTIIGGLHGTNLDISLDAESNINETSFHNHADDTSDNTHKDMRKSPVVMTETTRKPQKFQGQIPNKNYNILFRRDHCGSQIPTENNIGIERDFLAGGDFANAKNADTNDKEGEQIKETPSDQNVSRYIIRREKHESDDGVEANATYTIHVCSQTRANSSSSDVLDQGHIIKTTKRETRGNLLRKSLLRKEKEKGVFPEQCIIADEDDKHYEDGLKRIKNISYTSPPKQKRDEGKDHGGENVTDKPSKNGRQAHIKPMRLIDHLEKKERIMFRVTCNESDLQTGTEENEDEDTPETIQCSQKVARFGSEPPSSLTVCRIKSCENKNDKDEYKFTDFSAIHKANNLPSSYSAQVKSTWEKNNILQVQRYLGRNYLLDACQRCSSNESVHNSIEEPEEVGQEINSVTNISTTRDVACQHSPPPLQIDDKISCSCQMSLKEAAFGSERVVVDSLESMPCNVCSYSNLQSQSTLRRCIRQEGICNRNASEKSIPEKVCRSSDMDVRTLPVSEVDNQTQDIDDGNDEEIEHNCPLNVDFENEKKNDFKINEEFIDGDDYDKIIYPFHNNDIDDAINYMQFIEMSEENQLICDIENKNICRNTIDDVNLGNSDANLVTMNSTPVEEVCKNNSAKKTGGSRSKLKSNRNASSNSFRSIVDEAKHHSLTNASSNFTEQNLAKPGETGHQFIGDYLLKLWKKQVLCDVRVNVENTFFLVHKLVLAAFSDVFTPTNPYPPPTLQFTVPCATPEAVYRVFNYIYTASMDVEDRQLEDILHIGIFLGINEVKDVVMEILSRPTLENVEMYIDIRNRCGIPTSLLDYPELYRYNLIKLINLEKYLELSTDELEGIMKDPGVLVETEVDTLHALAAWAQYNPLERLSEVPRLLDYIIFEVMTPDSISKVVQLYDPIFSEVAARNKIGEVFRFHALKLAHKDGDVAVDQITGIAKDPFLDRVSYIPSQNSLAQPQYRSTDGIPRVDRKKSSLTPVRSTYSIKPKSLSGKSVFEQHTLTQQVSQPQNPADELGQSGNAKVSKGKRKDKRYTKINFHNKSNNSIIGATYLERKVDLHPDNLSQ